MAGNTSTNYHASLPIFPARLSSDAGCGIKPVRLTYPFTGHLLDGEVIKREEISVTIAWESHSWGANFLALKAESLYLVGSVSEALEAITEAEAWVERSEERWWSAELHRLRGVFLAAIGAEETQIEASFCETVSIAREQKSISLAKRAEETYAEYRRQKASGLEGRGFRLPL